MFAEQGRKVEHVSLRIKKPQNATKLERLQTLHRSISATKHRPGSLMHRPLSMVYQDKNIKSSLQKEVVSQRRKSKKLINQTALTPTPNFSAIGDQTADYEMIETFNQSLSNSIMHPVETESLKKQNKQVSFSRQQDGTLR